MIKLKLFILEVSFTAKMKSQGLGDDIEKFTKATGIKKMVDTVSKGLNIPCGCESRKQMLNKLFPHRYPK